MSTKYDEERLFDTSILESKQSLLPSAEVEIISAHKRELQKISKTITIIAVIGVVFSIISCCIIAGILLLSKTLNNDRKIFFGGILIVCDVGLLIVVCVAKSDPVALLLFTNLLTYVSALALGLSITYA
jgi:hypothetical protein